MQQSISHDNDEMTYFSAQAERSGHRLLDTVASAGIHLQRYDCQPGGWSHVPIGWVRIAIQEAESPRMIRKLGRRSESGFRSCGQISISPADVEQRWSWDRAMRLTLLFVRPHRLETLTDGRPFTLHMPLAVHDPVLTNAVHGLIETAGAGHPLARALTDAAGTYLAAHLLTRYDATNETTARPARIADWQLKRVLDFMKARMGEPTNLTDMAAEIGMSAHYFCRAFRMTMGVSPYQFMLTQRIELAKTRLLSGEQDLSSLAVELGFSSHSHFSSTFRRVAGCTPSGYRLAGHR